MINIAIDGTAGSGKSELTKGLAKKFNLKAINTGAIYRSIACLYRLSFGTEIKDENIERLLEKLKIEFKFERNNFIVITNEKDFSSCLRDEEISFLCSKISVYPKLRKLIKQKLRDFAQNNNCIVEGRDISTVVLPDADVKIFLTASVEERAMRRFLQLKQTQNQVDYEKILNGIKERDFRDQTRQISPLKPAEDSIIFDNTGMDIQTSIKKCAEIVTEKLKI